MMMMYDKDDIRDYMHPMNAYGYHANVRRQQASDRQHAVPVGQRDMAIEGVLLIAFIAAALAVHFVGLDVIKAAICVVFYSGLFVAARKLFRSLRR